MKNLFLSNQPGSYQVLLLNPTPHVLIYLIKGGTAYRTRYWLN